MTYPRRRGSRPPEPFGKSLSGLPTNVVPRREGAPDEIRWPWEGGDSGNDWTWPPVCAQRIGNLTRSEAGGTGTCVMNQNGLPQNAPACCPPARRAGTADRQGAQGVHGHGEDRSLLGGFARLPGQSMLSRRGGGSMSEAFTVRICPSTACPSDSRSQAATRRPSPDLPA